MNTRRQVLLLIGLALAVAAGCSDDEAEPADTTAAEDLGQAASEPEDDHRAVAVSETFLEAIADGDTEAAIAEFAPDYRVELSSVGVSSAQFWTGNTAYGPYEDVTINCGDGTRSGTAVCEFLGTDRLSRGLGYRLVWDFTFEVDGEGITGIDFRPNDGPVFFALYEFANANGEPCAQPDDQAPTDLTDADGSPWGTMCAEALVAAIPDFVETGDYVLPAEN